MIRSRLACSALFLASVLLAVPAWAGHPFLPKVVAAPGGANPYLYGMFGGSLVRSVDGGQTWIPIYITAAGLPQPNILDLEVDPIQNDTLYVQTSDPTNGLWKSTDAGQTWMPAMTGVTNSGSQVDFFKLVRDGNQIYLYLKKGNLLYSSIDRGAHWMMRGTLPKSDAVMDVADMVRVQMYLVERTTLQVYVSGDEGHSWAPLNKIVNTSLQGNTANAIHVVTNNPNRVYVSVDGFGPARGAYVTGDAGTTFARVSGLSTFGRMFTGYSGPLYATVSSGVGFYRAPADESAWNSYGSSPSTSFTMYAVNQNNRDVLWGLRGGNTNLLIRSADQGNSWQPVSSSLTPTLASPVAAVNVELPQGAPYLHAFDVTLFEDSSWAVPVTLSTSGESWLTLDSLGGTTPLTNAARIDTNGLAVGTYQSTVTINAPDSYNGSVSFNINLTVRAYGTVGPRYVISTIAGQGGSGETRTSGAATDLAIGGPKALRVGPEGKLWISSGNRLWRRDGTMLTAIAGNGTKGSTGDGLTPLSAEISDPDGIAFDSQMVPHLAEYDSARIRRITSGAIRTQVEFSTFGFTTGSHSIVIDPFGNLLMANPKGILIFNGSKLQVRTAFAFVDPWGMVQDANGNLFVTDRGAHRIYKVTPTDVVTVVAGVGTRPGFDGDGGPASAARLNAPSGIAMGPDGSLYFADTGNERIRKIAPGGTITTIAGTGSAGFEGDGYTTEYAAFQDPDAVAVDADGKVYVADAGNNRVRMLVLTPEADLPPPPTIVTPPPTKPSITHIDRGGSIGGPLSPGAVFSIYGANLAGARTTSSAIPWPASIDDVSVTINGRTAPIFFVDPAQINGQVPFETELGTTTVVVTFNGTSSAAFQFQVVPASPGVLVFDTDRAVMQNQDYSVNTADNPIRPGEIGTIYLSGIGLPTVPIPTGAASPGPPTLAEVNYPYSISVGGVAAEVKYLGYTPGFPTLAQANVVIPNLAPGDHLVIVTVNGVSSEPLKITVGAP